MMKKLTLTAVVAAFGLAAGAAEWISAVDAPVADAALKKTCRAPDGTSWFAASVRNRADVRRAVWRVTALGVFDVYVNGRRVGDDFLKPGYTHARKLRYRYDYDVTAELKTKTGEANDLAAEVSHGWWSDGIAAYPGVKPAFWGELEIEYADGTRQVFGTDRTAWRAGVGGPVVHAGIYDGETYDARIDAPVRGSSAWGVPEANAEFAGEILPVSGAKVVLRRVGFVKAAYRSASGVVRSAWRYDGDGWLWEFTVPDGAKADVTLPGSADVREYAAGTHRVHLRGVR